MPLRDINDEVDKQFAKREHEIKALFPQDWTNANDINLLAVLFQLKVMGFDFRDDKQQTTLLAAIEAKGLILRDGLKFKRNPEKIYKETKPLEISPLIPLDTATKRLH